MKRRAGSVSRRPESADMSEHFERMFETAGLDVEPIELESVNHEIKFLSQNINSSAEWDAQVAAMQRLNGLINGGALENDDFRRDLIQIAPGLTDAARNLRSALVKQSCLVISQLTREMGPCFDQLGDFIIPLSKQLVHGTQIIADSCKYTILCIARNSQSRKVLNSLFELSNNKGAAQKDVAAQSIYYVISEWASENVNSSQWTKLEVVLKQLLGCASPTARQWARQAVISMKTAVPKRAAEFIKILDTRTQNAIREEPALPESVRRPQAAVQVPLRPIKSKEAITNNEMTMGQKRSSSVTRIRQEPKKSIKPEIDVLDLSHITESKQEIGSARRAKPVIRQNYKPEPASARPEYNASNNNSNKFGTTISSRRTASRQETTRFDNVSEHKDKRAASRNTNNDNHEPISQRTQSKQSETYDVDMTEPIPKRTASRVTTRIEVPTIPKRVLSKQTEREEYQEPELEPVHVPVPKRSASRQTENNPIKQTIPRRTSSRQTTREEAPVSARIPKRTSSRQTTRDEPQVIERPAHSSRTSSLRSKPRSESKQEVRRPPSPEPIVDPYAFIKGQERTFLGNIRIAINEGRLSDLEHNISRVILNVVNCCISSVNQISATATSILHDLIPAFSSYFQSSLPKLMPMILSLIENGNSRTSSSAQLILNEFPDNFDVNQLLKIAIEQKPTIALLHFLGKLTSMVEVDLSVDVICVHLLEIATYFQNSNEVQNQHTAAHVISRIHSVNHSIIIKYAESLEPNELQKFEHFIRPYIPELSFQTVGIEVPKFNAKSATSFRQQVSDLLKKTSPKEWVSIRSQVYDELNEALMCPSGLKQTLQLVSRIFNAKGVKDFQRMLPGLLIQTKSDYSQYVDDIFTIFLKEVETFEIIGALSQRVNCSNDLVSLCSINTITRILSSIESNKAQQTYQILYQSLQKAFAHKAPEIRKAVVLCFVEMKAIAAEQADKFIAQLPKAQQKLISVYFARRAA